MIRVVFFFKCENGGERVSESEKELNEVRELNEGIWEGGKEWMRVGRSGIFV